MKRLSVLAAALLAASCAIGPRGQIATFDVPADQAAFLTVIRPSTLGFCCTIPLFVDGRKVLGLWVREHATITIPAGERTIAIQKGYSFNTLTIQAKPGGHYYVVMELL